MSAADVREVFVSAADGLRIFARDEGPLAGEALPVVCLPGLARTTADFASLSRRLASDETRPRRVVSIDYRGRGRSEWDKDWRRYDLRVELEDVLQVLTATGVEEAVFVGTSRGAIMSMALGALRPTLLRGVVLNDCGPVIEAQGLARIRGYVGKLPAPRDWPEAADILRHVMGAQFPGFTEPEWERFARGTWNEGEGGLVLAYDPRLLKTLEAVDLEAPLPDLWPYFRSLAHVPVLVLRGAHSDILSPRTLEAMLSAHPRLEAMTVSGQGHAPLIEGEVLERVARFVAEAERTAPVPMPERATG